MEHWKDTKLLLSPFLFYLLKVKEELSFFFSREVLRLIALAGTSEYRSEQYVVHVAMRGRCPGRCVVLRRAGRGTAPPENAWDHALH
jgi:hypothetical protein